MRLNRERVGVGPDGRELTVDGISIAYADSGPADAPVIVCLHAIGHGAGDFEPLRARLGDRYRIVAFDWPGQGRSNSDSVPAGAARYAHLLRGVLDGLGIERAILLGNSIGGAAAIRFAAEHPSRVQALVLCNPGGLTPINAVTRRFCDGMAAFFRAGAGRSLWFPRAFDLYYRVVLQERAARDQRARIVDSAREIAAVCAQAWTGFARPDADLRGLAPSVTQPVLFAWGWKDPIVAYPLSRPGVARFPHHRVELLPSGHSPFLEIPDRFAALLREFVDNLPDGASVAA